MPVPDHIVFPAHALLIVEERLKDHEADGIRMPEGMPLAELALRVLVCAEITANAHTASPGSGRRPNHGHRSPH
jgi:hypothetical protein